MIKGSEKNAWRKKCQVFQVSKMQILSDFLQCDRENREHIKYIRYAYCS